MKILSNKRYEDLQKSIANYKRKYADELQKRLDLVKIIEEFEK